jgi:hypothetical protein
MQAPHLIHIPLFISTNTTNELGENILHNLCLVIITNLHPNRRQSTAVNRIVTQYFMQFRLDNPDRGSNQLPPASFASKLTSDVLTQYPFRFASPKSEI